MAALTAPQISLLTTISSQLVSLSTILAGSVTRSKGAQSPEATAANAALTDGTLTTLASQLATVAGGG